MEERKEIEIPYNFTPRTYQLPIFEAMERGFKRIILNWARRHGKDLTCWHILIQKAVEVKGTYYLIFPTYSQARKAFWDAITEDGIAYLDYVPKELIASKLTHEMKLKLRNGSILQVLGSENPDAIRGTNPCGVVLSEYAYQSPTIFTYILDPILTKNKGWIIFNSTPQGRNHYYDMTLMAQQFTDEWLVSTVTIKDTNLVTEEEIVKKRAQGVSEELIQQEYFCNFSSGVLGSYYGRCLDQAREEHRIGKVNYDPNLLVYTAWDLGYSDSTSIVFFQKRGQDILIIDCYENHGYALSHYLDILREKKYAYGKHFIPHDAKAHNVATGTSFLTVASQSEFSFKVIEDRRSIMDGIEHVRGMFQRFYFDEDKCDFLLRCLQGYHAAWDDRAKVFRDTPAHDWTSHSGDCVRYMSLAINTLGSSSTGMSREKLSQLKEKYRPHIS